MDKVRFSTSHESLSTQESVRIKVIYQLAWLSWFFLALGSFSFLGLPTRPLGLNALRLDTLGAEDTKGVI